MKNIAFLVSLMLVTSAGMALAWGPNDPTDTKADPDGDKLGNLDEFRYGTNPLNPDTDGGGCWDGWEVMYGLDPAYAKDDLFDTDLDGWSNLREFYEGTDPTNPNTDGDFYHLDSTDPHPLIPDGPHNGSPDPGIGPGEQPGPNPGPIPPIPGPVIPMPGPPGPWHPNPHPGPIVPIPPEHDTDHDGLVEFIDGL